MIVTEEDKKFLKNTREAIERAKYFKKMSVNVTVGLEDDMLENEEDEAFDMIIVFLNSLDKIIKVKNANEKHESEIEAIDEIMRDIPDICGEKCRDFIKHFSNLQKNFSEITKTSLKL